MLDAECRQAAAQPIMACNGAGLIAGGSVEGAPSSKPAGAM